MRRGMPNDLWSDDDSYQGAAVRYITRLLPGGPPGDVGAARVVTDKGYVVPDKRAEDKWICTVEGWKK